MHLWTTRIYAHNIHASRHGESGKLGKFAALCWINYEEVQKIAHQQWNGHQHKSSDTTYETSMKLPSYLSKHLHTSIYLIEWTNVPKSHIDKKHWQRDRITISGIQREGVLHNLSNTQRQKHARGDFTAPTTIQPKGTAIIYICIPCWMVGESWIPLVPISHGISYHMRH